MTGYRDLPLWQASCESDRRIIERAWEEIPDTGPEWIRGFVASFTPWAERTNRAMLEFVVHMNQVFTPERVITPAVAEYNRRMAEINRQ
jgi:hypothetical protein